MNHVLTQINPATGEPIQEIRETTSEETTAAMHRARAAFLHWGQTSVAERVQWMRRLREHLVDHAASISHTIAVCTGKVDHEALMTEVFTVADAIHHYEQSAEKTLGTKPVTTPLLFWGSQSYLEYKPMGVIAVISPWNFPFQLAMIPVVSALLAGNCVLLKPSEVTAGVGVLMEEIFGAIGLPENVVQVLHGGREVGSALVQARPDKIFFTGSVATGKKIMSVAAEHLIPVDLELGGKDPMIVFADSDLERASDAAVWGAFTNAGQVCMSVERVYVEQSVYGEFLRKVLTKTLALRMGVDYGSMTFPAQVDIVESHLRDALEKGAQIECGGERLQEGTLYFAPTILTGVDHSMLVMQEETFGPLMPIMSFQSEAEVIHLANDTPYGLNASVWSTDLSKAKRVASHLISGNVCINDVITTVANPHLPFGGVKHSGMGRYHAEIGLQTFCHQTSVMASQGGRKREINWYPYTPTKAEAISTLTRLLYGKSRRVGWSALRTLIGELFAMYRKTKPTPPSSANDRKNVNM